MSHMNRKINKDVDCILKKSLIIGNYCVIALHLRQSCIIYWYVNSCYIKYSK